MIKRAEIILFVCLLNLTTSFQFYSIAQTTLLKQKIENNFNNLKISKIIDEISNQTGIYFSYNSDIIPDKKVSLVSHDLTIEKILDTLLNSDSVVYKFEEFENHIIILKKGENKKIGKILNFNEENVKTINGIVVEKYTEKPIPFAHVLISERNTRTITNIDGKFILHINNPLPTDTLEISFIGYKTYKTLISFLDTGQIFFELRPYTYQIEQVIVKPIDPIELINNAIERIPDNYEKGSSILTAFFREINKLNNEYISISEAVISIFKSNYALEYDSDKIKILKGRKNQNINVLDDYDFKVIGGLYYNFKLDIVKDKVSFIDPEYFISYNYEYSKIININDRPAYEILFDQKENIQDLLYQGKLYIDVETYAIVGTEFQFSPKAIDNASSLLIKKKPPSAKIEPFYSYYKTDYIFKNGKWYLNNVKSEVHLHVLNRKTNNYSQFSTTSEFIITDRYTKDIKKFKRKDISKSTDVFVDQISKEYDEEFWGKYNIIQPDKSLIEAYKELNKNKYFFIVNKELSDE